MALHIVTSSSTTTKLILAITPVSGFLYRSHQETRLCGSRRHRKPQLLQVLPTVGICSLPVRRHKPNDCEPSATGCQTHVWQSSDEFMNPVLHIQHTQSVAIDATTFKLAATRHVVASQIHAIHMELRTVVAIALDARKRPLATKQCLAPTCQETTQVRPFVRVAACLRPLSTIVHQPQAKAMQSLQNNTSCPRSTTLHPTLSTKTRQNIPITIMQQHITYCPAWSGSVLQLYRRSCIGKCSVSSACATNSKLGAICNHSLPMSTSLAPGLTSCALGTTAALGGTTAALGAATSGTEVVTSLAAGRALMPVLRLALRILGVFFKTRCIGRGELGGFPFGGMLQVGTLTPLQPPRPEPHRKQGVWHIRGLSL